MSRAFVSLIIILLIALIVLCAVGTLLMALMLLRPSRMTDGKAAWVLKRLSPGDLGMRFEELRFTVRDEASAGEKLTLAAWWIPHPAITARCVVLIHGYADAKVGATAWAPTWQSLGYNILALDLRAHGESGGRFSTAGFFERHDLNQVLDQLQAMRPGETQALVLFGVSLGAAVALSAAAVRESDDIAAIVLECPFADFRNAVMQHAKMMNMPAPILQRASIYVAQWISGARFAKVRPVDLVERVRCPLMLIESRNDMFVSEWDKLALRAAMAGRNPAKSRFLQIEEAGHVVGICADPELYRAHVEAFLDPNLSRAIAAR